MLCLGDFKYVFWSEIIDSLIFLLPAESIYHSVLTFWSRRTLFQVQVPCHILQSSKDLAVPVVVASYLHHALGGPSAVEILQTEGHLPQLSAPDVVIPVLKRHLVCDVCV